MHEVKYIKTIGIIRNKYRVADLRYRRLDECYNLWIMHIFPAFFIELGMLKITYGY